MRERRETEWKDLEICSPISVEKEVRGEGRDRTGASAEALGEVVGGQGLTARLSVVASGLGLRRRWREEELLCEGREGQLVRRRRDRTVRRDVTDRRLRVQARHADHHTDPLRRREERGEEARRSTWSVRSD